uniref:tRNA uridine 5-carboxymethylaminomethyl modification enzyme C-terminal subdomain domain-containing protein n=1 Tax=Micrurus lemniscatus lemniscatus TaxID=129467 RepID=A0A2D4J5Z3_MICLE
MFKNITFLVMLLLIRHLFSIYIKEYIRNPNNCQSMQLRVVVFLSCIFCFFIFFKLLSWLFLQAVYDLHVANQKLEIEEVRQDEALRLPEDLDYLTIDVSLSQEVREILDAHRPPTIGAISRIPGVTPAAVCHLLRFVKGNHGRAEQIDNLSRTAEPLSAAEVMGQRKFEAVGYK